MAPDSSLKILRLFQIFDPPQKCRKSERRDLRYIINSQASAPADGVPERAFMARQPRAWQNNLSQPSHLPPLGVVGLISGIEEGHVESKKYALHRALAKGLGDETNKSKFAKRTWNVRWNQ